MTAAPGSLSGSCGGGLITVTATSVTLGGASLGAGASCTFTVTVTGTQVGFWVNSVAGFANGTGTGAATTSALTVNSQAGGPGIKGG